MSEDPRQDLDTARREPVDPVKMARRDLQKTLPRRFYSEVTIAAEEGGFGPHLDGKPIRTPARAMLNVPTRALAEAIAAEWGAQTELIDPETMPLTRLANSALDGVARTLAATIDEVAKFAETDLVCYRAGDPDALVTAQGEAWDPVLAFARETLGARFVCVEGLMYVEQPRSARAAVREAVETIAAGPAGVLRLAAPQRDDEPDWLGADRAGGRRRDDGEGGGVGGGLRRRGLSGAFLGNRCRKRSPRRRCRWRDMDAAASLYALAD